jgi:aspartate/methionine/tyrosine aminotransferase
VSADRRIASTVAGIEVSAIKEMSMRSAGLPETVSLAWGLPSFRTPEPIRRAVATALESDARIGQYALPDGLPELRRAVADEHRQRTGADADPETEIMISAGNMQALSLVFRTLVEAGDEVILTDPGFASHWQQIRLCGGVPVGWALDEARGWALDPETLPALIGPRTKAVVLVSPSNPTGSVFDEHALRRVGEIALEHDLMVLVDDPYSHFLYEHRDRWFNLASVPALAGHLVYMFTFSKAYAMSGWRLAYLVLPAWLKHEVLKVHDATLICTPRISQVAGLAGLTGDRRHLAQFEATLARRRQRVCERLDGLAGTFEYQRPEGAYYVFPRILADHDTAHAFALRALDEARVALTPGSAFGPAGEHHVRIAFCVEDDVIDRAFDRLEAWLGGQR